MKVAEICLIVFKLKEFQQNTFYIVSSELCDAFLKQRKARLELTIGKPKQQVKIREKIIYPKRLLMMLLYKYSCKMTKGNKQML